MSDITLSKAVRSNLLSLQNTASLMGKTQERLSTGNKVNSALDNPTNFFTASALNSRASDLGLLMDSVGNAVQTIAAADKGIKAITKLVESAQATARQALQSSAPATSGGGSSGSAGSATATGAGVAFTNNTAATSGASANAWSTLANDEVLTINGTDYTFKTATPNAGNNEFTTIAELDALLAAEDIDASGTTNLTLTATDNTTDIEVTGTAAAKLGLVATAADTETFSATSSAVKALTGTISYTRGSASGTITLSGHDTVADLEAAFDAAGFTASFNGSGNLIVNSTDAFTLTDGTGTVASVLGTGATSGTPVAVTGGSSGSGGSSSTTNKRAELLEQFNDLMDQIDQLAKDAGFNGVNLLQEDDLSVLFNEDGSSKLDIAGINLSATGSSLLDLEKITDTTAWDTNAGINTTLDKLKAGIDTLRTQASKFGSNLSVVENRQSFTKDMINVLQTGAANLTLADTNEEAANLLALQTRQSLSSTALSMASQADQSVLQLLR